MLLRFSGDDSGSGGGSITAGASAPAVMPPLRVDANDQPIPQKSVGAPASAVTDVGILSLWKSAAMTSTPVSTVSVPVPESGPSVLHMGALPMVTVNVPLELASSPKPVGVTPYNPSVPGVSPCSTCGGAPASTETASIQLAPSSQPALSGVPASTTTNSQASVKIIAGIGAIVLILWYFLKKRSY